METLCQSDDVKIVHQCCSLNMSTRIYIYTHTTHTHTHTHTHTQTSIATKGSTEPSSTRPSLASHRRIVRWYVAQTYKTTTKPSCFNSKTWMSVLRSRRQFNGGSNDMIVVGMMTDRIHSTSRATLESRG